MLKEQQIIKQLSKVSINRIAAGEVVERPASVVKELVENSIDADAKNIEVSIRNGGRNLISISDDGFGMSKEDLELATERHTTSKLNEDDILNIQFFGFRGEALPSIASVSRMKIVSRKDGSDSAWQLEIEAGEKQRPIPASRTKGTLIEVRDIFCSTPARLKFLKTEKTEENHIIEIVSRIAMSHPEIGFKLVVEGKIFLDVKSQESRERRVAEIMKSNFIENSVPVFLQEEQITITGYASLPTHNRGTSSEQYLYVNSRAVRDKILLSAIKSAYQDYLARDRHPFVVLFIKMPFEDVDVNVHPAKTEVRFRNSGLIRSLIVKALKEALNQGAYKTSSEIAQKTIASFKPETPRESRFDFSKMESSMPRPSFPSGKPTSEMMPKFSFKERQNLQKAERLVNEIPEIQHEKNKDLGNAKCQLHETYIISQTSDSIIVTDQHAAHERLVYEKLKKDLAKNDVETQRLLISETMELDSKSMELIMEAKEELEKMGLVFSKCGQNSILISEVPALIGSENIVNLVRNICDDLIEHGENLSLKEISEHILGTFACHRSVRAGRKLSLEEMDALLRQMEETPFSGQCNHGRPTYVELDLKSIDRLFGRS